MKNLLIVAFLIGFVSISANAQTEDNETLKGIIKVEVDGLSCPFCAYGLEKKLKKMDGVKIIEIDVENAFAQLTLAPGKTVTKAIIRQKVDDAGFTARKITEISNDE